MRCNWRRWLWGVIPLVALGLAAVHVERAAIEQDLTERAQEALKAKGAQWAVVNFTGRDVVLKGNATSENEPGEAVAVLKSVWGVGKVKNDAGLPKLVEPYVWSANRRGSRVRLTGHYPNAAMKQTIIGMTRAAVPGLELVSRMTAARGVPPADTWLAGVSFALKQLAALKRGDVRLEGLALTISGEAENEEAYKQVTAALKRGLPKGITLASAEIAAPLVSPFTWSAEFAGGQLVLSGHVPSEAARADLLAAARSAASTDVVDRMEVARGAASGAAEAAAALIKEIVRLQSANVELKDATVVVTGVAADEAQAQSVRERLRASLPPAFKLTDQIRVREPKVEPKAETKPAEAPKVEAKPAEEPKAEMKSAEAPKVEAKPAEEPKVETKSAEAPKVEAKPAEEPKAEAKSVEAPKVETKPAEDQKAETKSAEAPEVEVKPGEEQKAETKSAEAPEVEAKPAEEPKAETKETALLTPPAASQEKPSVPKTAPTPQEKVPSSAAEAQPKSEPSPGRVDVAVCRGDVAKLAAGNPVLFERGSARLERAGRKTLDQIAQAMKGCPGVRVVAEGHTDNEGNTEYNMRLSLKRAEAVKEYLVEAGVAAETIETAGFGTTRPAAPNTSAQTRAKNRRTEISVRP